MGFSALDGLPMGTRCGAIDAGVVFFMLREMKLTPEEAERVLYTKSGLLGVSGLSNDMRVLRANAATNADARRAIDLFVYRVTREIGSLIAALGGIDGLVFTAGIGENDVGDPRRGDRRPRLDPGSVSMRPPTAQADHELAPDPAHGVGHPHQ